MDRRRFLGHGTALLPTVLAGCVGSSSPDGSGTNDSTTRVQPSSSTSVQTSTTTEDGHEDYLIGNDDSSTRTVTVAVTPKSGDQEPLVDATYEVPSEHILEFPDLLEHGQRYHFEVTVSQGRSDTMNTTIEGCANDTDAPSGDSPLIVWIDDDAPDHFSIGCDTPLNSTYPRGLAEQYKVSE